MAILNNKPFAHPEVYECLAEALAVSGAPPEERRRVVKEWLQDHSNGCVKQFVEEGREGKHTYRVTLDFTKRVRVRVKELTEDEIKTVFGGHPDLQPGKGRGERRRWFTVKFVLVENVRQ